jgi:hypothetical protein
LQLLIGHVPEITHVHPSVFDERANQMLQSFCLEPAKDVGTLRCKERANLGCKFKLPRAVSFFAHDGRSCAEEMRPLEQPELKSFETRLILEGLWGILNDIHTCSLDPRSVRLKVNCGKPSIELLEGAHNSSFVTGFSTGFDSPANVDFDEWPRISGPQFGLWFCLWRWLQVGR